MPRNRKQFIHNTPYEICFRAERGLPLVATKYMEVILEGILAQAQTLYFVKVCSFVFMSNHVHMLIVVEDPSVVDSFVEYVKRESSHAVNRLLGRNRYTVWCSGYDSPSILDPEAVIKRLVYIYTNPQTANLVETIKDYPNLNTWDCFLKGGKIKKTRRVIPRSSIAPLPRAAMSFSQHDQLAMALKEEASREATLIIEPDAWMKCFPETESADPIQYRKEVIARVQMIEGEIKRARKVPVFGAHALRLEPMDKVHVPKKHGKKMICLASSNIIRQRFITWFKVLSARAKKAIQNWMKTKVLSDLPPGFFAPGGSIFSSINPHAIKPF